MKKTQEEKILNKIDKFLFRLQANILSVLLPEIKGLVKEQEDCHREAAIATNQKEGK
jgi:hypothetical protein